MQFDYFVSLFQGITRTAVGASLILALFCGGCSSSTLLPIGVPEVVTRRASSIDCSSSKRCVQLVSEISDSVSESLGSQFLLLVIPLGRTKAGHIQETTFNTAYKELVLMGFQPVLKPPRSSKVPVIHLSITDVSISTYDLLVTRLVKTRIGLRVAWAHRPDSTVDISHESSSYYRLPFSEELTREYQLTLEAAFRSGMRQLLGRS